MSSTLTASLEATSSGEAGDHSVVLRIVNSSEESAEVLNPDVGRPSRSSNWPFSQEAYRATLLMSYGYLDVSVRDADGRDLERVPMDTLAVHALRTPLELAPGDSIGVVVPIGRFFELEPGTEYRVGVEYGMPEAKVRAEGVLPT